MKKLFNANKEEIEVKKYNIFIGISLGNKWFTKENLREYLKWALKHTKEKVLIFIVDEIQAINYNVRNKKYSEKENLQRALRNGKQIKGSLKNLLSEFPEEDKKKIKILRWESYKDSDSFYKKYTPKVYEEFETNQKFKKQILNLVKNMIQDREFSEEDYLNFSKYLLEEFVASYSGIKYFLDYYGFFIYPQESPLHEFIIKIQKGKIFSDLNKKLPKEKVAWGIMN